MGVMLLLTVQAIGELAIMVSITCPSMFDLSLTLSTVSRLWWLLHPCRSLYRSFMGVCHGLASSTPLSNFTLILIVNAGTTCSSGPLLYLSNVSVFILVVEMYPEWSQPVTAATFTIQYWAPNFSVPGGITIFWVVIIGLNVFGTLGYAEVPSYL
jgi:hypothetical protein